MVMMTVALLATGAGARAQDGARAPTLAYDASLIGLDDDALRRAARAAARVFDDPAPEFASLPALRRQTRRDGRRIQAVLTAEGYYAARVDAEALRVAPARDGADARAAAVFEVAPGPRFVITDYRITYRDAQPAPRPATLADLGLEADFSPRGADIAALEAALLTTLRAQGFPTARRVDRRAEADFRDAAARIVFEIESGPAARFGPVDWRGLTRTRIGFLNRQIPWKEGEPFSRDALSAYRDTLEDTRLFRYLQLEPGAPDADGLAPVIATVREAPPRTIAAGVSFATNRGVGGALSWEHRNLWRRGERLRVEADAAQIEQAVAVQLRKPYPRARLAAFTGLEAAREDNDAFRADRVTVNAGFEKRFRRRWTARGGVEVETSRSEDAFGETDALLAALPVRVVWDSVEEPLDPKDGLRVAADVIPVAGDAEGGLAFVRQELTVAAHQPLSRQAGVIAAGWARLGSIAGAQNADIPATRRFFAGGGGSVRAYGFQRLGPLDEDDQPLGGRSVLEGGVEVRGRVAQRWGAAAFVEAGAVSSTNTPTVRERVLAGAGLGARYYTPVGPFRLDIAFPFDRRGGLDSPVQVYVSFGQAF